MHIAILLRTRGLSARGYQDESKGTPDISSSTHRVPSGSRNIVGRETSAEFGNSLVTNEWDESEQSGGWMSGSIRSPQNRNYGL